MTQRISEGKIDQLFAIFVKHAIAGTRCPVANDLPAMSSTVARELARRGRILIEVSGANWRQITILQGDHAGKKTAPDPSGRQPYRVIGIEDRLHGELYAHKEKLWLVRKHRI